MRLTTTVFFHRCFDKQRFQSFLRWFFKKSSRGQSRLLQFLEKLKFLGFHSATEAGFSISIEDLKIPPSKSALLEAAEKSVFEADLQLVGGSLTSIEHYQRILEIWHRTSEKLKYQVLQSFHHSDLLNPVYLMAFSGARGNISQIRQLVGMRGLMADPQGQIIDFPIRSNFREGLTLTEYLISCSGARKGIVDTALRTAASGYLTRRLVDVAHHVVVSQMDCQHLRSPTQPIGIFVESLYDKHKKILPLKQRLVGRVLAENITESGCLLASKNQEISQTLSQKICAYRKKVCVRSPLTCQSSKFLCQLCYGWNLAEGQLVSIGEAVGVLAAQSIGEPGTQLTMRTFHTGGVFTGQLLDQTYAPFSGKIHYPSFCYGFLIRTLQGQIAYFSKNSGVFHLKVSYVSSHRQQQLEKMCWKFKKIFSSPTPVNRGKHLFEIQFVFQKTTLLYTRQGESVKKSQLLAEIPFLETEASSEKEQPVFSSFSGEMHFENCLFIEKTVNKQMFTNIVQGLSELWILSGQPLKFLNQALLHSQTLQKKRFFKKLDLVDHQVPFFQVQFQPLVFQKNVDSQLVDPKLFSPQFQLQSSKQKDWIICSVLFKKKGYLQIPYRALWPFIQKKIFQMRNGETSKSSKIWKNWPKITLFQTWKIGFQRDYLNFRSQLFPICLKSQSFKPVARIGRNFLYSTSPSNTIVSEFPKFLVFKNFFFQKNTGVVQITRQGFFKFFGIYQERQTPSFFQNPYQRRLQTQRIATDFQPKNFVNQRPIVRFFPTSRAPQSSRFCFSIKKKKCRQMTFFSVLFFDRLKFFQNRQPLPQWPRQNLQRQPLLLHWKNLSHHKYLFLMNFFQPLNRFSSIELIFQQKVPMTLGVLCSLRVLFYQEKSTKFDPLLAQNQNWPFSTSSLSAPLDPQKGELHQAFFQFLVSLQRLFYKNLLKKFQQKKRLTHSLFELTQLTVSKTQSALYSLFFLQGFREIFLHKKGEKRLFASPFPVFLNQQFFKKPLNHLQFETFKKPSKMDVWRFFGESVPLLKTYQRPTYLKTWIYPNTSSRQLKNAFCTIWPPFQHLSRKKRKSKRSAKYFFYLAKILPFSLREGSPLFENGFFQKTIFPLNYQIFSAKLQKWKLDFSIKPYASIVQNFCLIKNFEMRFSQKFPKKPIEKNFFLKKQTQDLPHFPVPKSVKMSRSQRGREFHNFYVEYISKKSFPLKEGFHQVEKEPSKNFNTYSLRFCPSLLIPRQWKEYGIMRKKHVFKKMLLTFENRSFVCVYRKQNLENFYSSQIDKKLFEKCTKKPIQPTFQIFTHIKTFLQIYQNPHPYKLKLSKKRSHKRFQKKTKKPSFQFFMPFSQRKFQIILKSVQPYPLEGLWGAMDRVFENTNLLTMGFFKIQNFHSVNSENFQKNALQILQRHFHPRCFEKQIVVRFYMPFPEGEMIHDHPVFLTLFDMFCARRVLAHRQPTLKNLRPLVLFFHWPKRPLNNWQLLCLTTRQASFSQGSLTKFQKTKVYQLGELQRAGVCTNPSIVTSGQLLAKTRQNFLFRKAATHLLNNQSIVHVHQGAILSKNQRICSVFYHQSKTEDIIQGIPKIEEIFEARKKYKYKLSRLSVFSNQKGDYRIFHYLHALQKSVINNIQRIYCGQGVHISDKHIEIIVRQMTSTVRILEPGQTGLLFGEIVAFQWMVKMHSTVSSPQIVYEPLFRGITKTSLETSSFLSAASFQETTRILSRAAIQNQVDFLRGLKQNVVLGNLLPLGTGCFRPLCT